MSGFPRQWIGRLPQSPTLPVMPVGASLTVPLRGSRLLRPAVSPRPSDRLGPHVRVEPSGALVASLAMKARASAVMPGVSDEREICRGSQLTIGFVSLLANRYQVPSSFRLGATPAVTSESASGRARLYHGRRSFSVFTHKPPGRRTTSIYLFDTLATMCGFLQFVPSSFVSMRASPQPGTFRPEIPLQERRLHTRLSIVLTMKYMMIAHSLWPRIPPANRVGT